MDANQRLSKPALPELHEGAGSLTPSARPEANYNVQQNTRIVENR